MPLHSDQPDRLDPDVPRITIAGCPVDSISRADTLAFVERVISERTPTRHGFVNASKVVRLQSDPELLEALATCDLINADGMAVVWASRILGKPLPERINGTNMMMDVINLADRKGYSLYLLGARPKVVEKVAHILRRDYPAIRLMGWHHGYFSLEEEDSIVREIRQLNPDIVFVGMGTPKKEFWLRRNVAKIGVPFAMGVGGSFDVLAGLVKRAPNWAQNAGLEWLWRLAQEPRRMWRRYLLGNPHFMWLVASEKIHQRRETASQISKSPWRSGEVRRTPPQWHVEKGSSDEGLPTLNVLGVEIGALNMIRTIRTIESLISSKQQGYISCVAAHSLMECRRDSELRRIFNASRLTTPDGMSLVWLLRLSGHRHVERVYGPDLMLDVCQDSTIRGYRHFLFGGAPGVPEKLANRLLGQNPGLHIVGTYSPPMRSRMDNEDQQAIDQINAAQPDIVWVGIGTPKQERWMAEHMGKITAPALIGVGAAFDFLSGHKPQAPRWMQNSGLEWLFRLLSEPRRLWRRYAEYPLFALLVLGQLLRLKRYEV